MDLMDLDLDYLMMDDLIIILNQDNLPALTHLPKRAVQNKDDRRDKHTHFLIPEDPSLLTPAQPFAYNVPRLYTSKEIQ